MTTPIYDFVKKYSESEITRFHMPGHKGRGELGCEMYDITEISGADILYSADGIINESENNLSLLYGTAHSFYSTEGSTLAIKAMLRLATEDAPCERSLVLAARNVHTAFIKAAALLDLDVEFIYSEREEHLCKCEISAEDVRRAILSAGKKPSAVYVTSPDYLGNILDISAISAVCRKSDIPLLVDNAHGAYLRFLPEDIHPISLGAAMSADSAHKTLSVLTGGAYLHISPDFSHLVPRAREALSLFASTSPSYLTLSSLDLCNKALSESYKSKLSETVKRIEEIKKEITSLGIGLCESEPLKIVFKDGKIASHLAENNIEVEFSDNDYTVLMITPENSESDFERLVFAVRSYKPTDEKSEIFSVKPHTRALSVRQAMLSSSEIISVDDASGRICASPTVSCPPAVPIVISGEIITDEDVKTFKHYGINRISVVK